MFNGKKDKPYVPIFGCRKRQQRHAAYANLDDLSSLPSSTTNMMPSSSNISMNSSDFDCFDIPMMEEERPPVSKKKMFQATNYHHDDMRKIQKIPLTNLSRPAAVLADKTNFQNEQQQSFSNITPRNHYTNNNNNFNNKYQQRQVNYPQKEIHGERKSAVIGNNYYDKPGTSRREHDWNNNINQHNRQNLNSQMSINFRSDSYQENIPTKKLNVLMAPPRPVKHQTNQNSTPFESNSSNTVVSNQSMLVSKMDKTSSKAPRFVSSKVGDVKKWKELLHDSPSLVFELVGILDSTITYNLPGVEKKFTLKDSTGIIRCVFWEMDRKILHLRRGSLIRCIGMLTKESIIHCVNVRSVAPSEQNLLQKLQSKCQEFLQEQILSREM